MVFVCSVNALANSSSSVEYSFCPFSNKCAVISDSRTNRRVKSHSFVIVGFESERVTSAFVPQRHTGIKGHDGLIAELAEEIAGSQYDEIRERERG